MSDTPRLTLPLIAAAQAQKHVTHNEALVKLDVLAHLHILDRDLNAPPAAIDGDTYLVAAGATGGWAGQDGKIAFSLDGAWAFYDAFSGLTGYVADEQAIIAYTGAGWQDYSALLSLQNVPLLGLGTTADAANPLAAKLNNTLFTAKTVSEGGDGDLRFKLNKETGADTVSQLYQSGFSGRAETGLLGNDDFTVKVSPDGSTWYEAIRIDKADGTVTFPSGGVRNQLQADRTCYVDGSSGDDANDGLSAGTAFATITRALQIVEALDLGGYHVTVDVANGTYAEDLVLRPLITGTATLLGDPATPSNVVIQGTSVCVQCTSASNQWMVDGIKVAGANIGIESLGYLSIQNIDFATTGVAQLRSNFGGTIVVSGNCTISAGGAEHVRAANHSRVIMFGKTITLTGTPNFTTAFARTQNGAFLRISDMTFTGSATGKKYTAETLSSISTEGSGASYLPGDVAGTVSDGGQYV